MENGPIILCDGVSGNNGWVDGTAPLAPPWPYAYHGGQVCPSTLIQGQMAASPTDTATGLGVASTPYHLIGTNPGNASWVAGATMNTTITVTFHDIANVYSDCVVTIYLTVQN